MEIKTSDFNQFILNIETNVELEEPTPQPEGPAHCPALSFTKPPLVNDQVPRAFSLIIRVNWGSYLPQSTEGRINVIKYTKCTEQGLDGSKDLLHGSYCS